jgi:hypothetical protein
MVAIVQMIKLVAAPHASAGCKVDAVAVRSAQVFRTLIVLLVLCASVLCGSALVSDHDGCLVPAVLADACSQSQLLDAAVVAATANCGCPRLVPVRWFLSAASWVKFWVHISMKVSQRAKEKAADEWHVRAAA